MTSSFFKLSLLAKGIGWMSPNPLAWVGFGGETTCVGQPTGVSNHRGQVIVVKPQLYGCHNTIHGTIVTIVHTHRSCSNHYPKAVSGCMSVQTTGNCRQVGELYS